MTLAALQIYNFIHTKYEMQPFRVEPLREVEVL